MELQTLKKEKIKKRYLNDQIYEMLSAKIIEGSIQYGERINIKEIARQLNVSAMPVRDAIKKLEMEDIVCIQPQSNCYVKIPTQTSMLDAFSMRTLLEIYALERICAWVTRKDLVRMGNFLEQMERHTPRNYTYENMKEYVKYDQLFHKEICVLDGNTSLLRSYHYNTLHLNIAFTFGAGVPPNMCQIEKDHRDIYENLLINSPDAVSALKRHLDICKSNMMSGNGFLSLQKA